MPGCTPGEAECALKARSVVNAWLLPRILNLGLPPVPSTRAPANPWANLLRAAFGYSTGTSSLLLEDPCPCFPFLFRIVSTLGWEEIQEQHFQLLKMK